MLVPFEVKKIAVLRANGIGDLMFALPALAALRAAYPGAEIVLLAKQWHAEFLQDRSGPVDRVIPIPAYPGVGAPENTSSHRPDLEAFFENMAGENFDIAIQLHGGGRHSNPFVRRLGARLTIGLRSPGAVALDRWVPYVYFQQEVIRYLEAVSLVSAKPVVLEPEIQVTRRDVAESEGAVPPDSRPLVVLHAGATDGRRRWAPERFGAVGAELTRRGFRVIVTGSREEEYLIRRVLEAMPCPGQGVSTLSLGGLAGLLSRAVLLVSNDSGPLHLGNAVGLATVGIYWCGNLFTAGPMTRARHRPAISWRLECPLCGRNTIQDNCDHHVSFVDDVPVTEVIEHCLELLGTLAETNRQPV
ncbi:MAG TPA: glycosyltransferase family 9 protein [Acidobacteriota bacterium]|nr:glycosyltransferase family 9 protein [Acidobacteriota bacterium]